jgi:hypothetical protein
MVPLTIFDLKILFISVIPYFHCHYNGLKPSSGSHAIADISLAY